MQLKDIGNLHVVYIFCLREDQEYVLLDILGLPFFEFGISNLLQGSTDTCFKKFHYALNHVYESSEKYPKIQGVQQTSQQPLLVPNGELEPIGNDFSRFSKLISYVVFLET